MAGKARLYRSNSYTPDDSNTDVFDTDFRYSSSVHHQKVRQRSKSYVENKTVFSRPTANRSKSYGDVNLSHFNKNITYIWKSALFSKYDIHVYSDAKKSIDAPDGGWGWLILLSSFVIQFIVIGFDGCAGILYMNFRDRYQQSAAISAWLGSLATALRLTLGPLASGLSNRFTERYVIMTSGVILSLSMILTGLSPSVVFVFLSFGLVGGIGRSFAYCPAIVMLGTYFRKKQGLVTGIAASGCGAGRFAMALLVPLLFRHFEFQGAFMLMGGVALQIVIMGALMRPLKVKMKKMNNDKHIAARKLSNNELPFSVNVTIPENKPIVSFAEKEVTVSKEAPKLFEFSLLKDMQFLGFCIAMLLSSLAEQSAFVFLPAFSKEIGVLDYFGPEYPLAITSVFNTVAKILAGFIFDCNAVRPYRVYLYNILMFGLVIISFALPEVKTFLQLVSVCAMYGMCAGSYTAQKSVVLVDILGRDKLRHSYGILMMFQGIGVFIGPPLSGFFKDINGRYDVAFYLGGVGMLIGATILLINNVVHYVRSKYSNTKNEDDKRMSLPMDIKIEPTNNNTLKTCASNGCAG